MKKHIKKIIHHAFTAKKFRADTAFYFCGVSMILLQVIPYFLGSDVRCPAFLFSHRVLSLLLSSTLLITFFLNPKDPPGAFWLLLLSLSFALVITPVIALLAFANTLFWVINLCVSLGILFTLPLFVPRIPAVLFAILYLLGLILFRL